MAAAGTRRACSSGFGPLADLGGGPPFGDAAVAACFGAFPNAIRPRLLWARALVFDTASETTGVGPLTETLKWGQPAYLTEATKSGTTLRLGAIGPDRWGVYVHCQTEVIPALQSTLPEAFSYDGTRGVVFGGDDVVDEGALRLLIRSALTYHAARKIKG